MAKKKDPTKKKIEHDVNNAKKHHNEGMIKSTTRKLYILCALMHGVTLKRSDLETLFNVDERTIRKDITAIQNILDDGKVLDNDENMNNIFKDITLVKDRIKGEYHIESKSMLTEADLLAMVKILSASRALPKTQMFDLINEKLCFHTSDKIKKEVRKFINNEKYHYKPIRGNGKVMDSICIIQRAIQENNYLNFNYERQDLKDNDRSMIPCCIVFADYYFYMIAVPNRLGLTDPSKKNGPYIFRIDRMKNIIPHKIEDTILDEFRKIEKPDEGKIVNQMPFMYNSPIRTITFDFWGKSIEAIKNKFPDCQSKKDGDIYKVSITANMEGALMFLLAQGPFVRITSPSDVKEEMEKRIKEMAEIYNISTNNK